MTIRTILSCAVFLLAVPCGAVRVSERFGYDPADATRFLQTALDSEERELVIDRQAGPWYAQPLFCTNGNKRIVLEDGAWVVAKRGAFKRRSECLLRFTSCRNVAIVGAGAEKCGFRMWRDDYMDPARYICGEHRHALSFLSCEDVTVRDVSTRGAGGDGLYIANTGKDGPPCRRVTVSDCTFDRGVRQGISVISVDGLLLERVRMTNTKGMPPEAGIDFEPNGSKEMISGVILRDCVTEDNAGSGYEFAVNFLDSESRKVTVRMENCRSSGDAGCAFDYVAAFHRAPGIDAEIPKDDVEFVLRNCTFERSGRAAVDIYQKMYAQGRFTFEDCTFDDCGRSQPDEADVSVSVTRHDGFKPNVLSFRNVTVRQPKARTWLDCGNPAVPFDGEPTRLEGEVKVISGGKAETVRMDAAWRQANLPFMPKARPLKVGRVTADLSSVSVVDAAPGEMERCRPVFLRTHRRVRHPEPYYVFRAEAGRKVRLSVGAMSVGAKNGKLPRQVAVRSYGGDSGDLWADSFTDEVHELEFEVPETGFYRLCVTTACNAFGITAANVPIALDVTRGRAPLFGIKGDSEFAKGGLYFHVPKGTAAFCCAYCGDGRETLAATLRDPSGRMVSAINPVERLRTVLVEAPAEGLWSLMLGKASVGPFEDYYLSLNGVPGWLFVCRGKYWK